MVTSTPSTAALDGVIAAYRTCEFATVTRHGTPIAWPVVTWQRPDGRFVLTTSIALPQKAFNIRRSPQVAMLFSDPTANGLVRAPQILVQGSASCPDEIVTDVNALPEYWTQLFARQPSGKSMSSVIGRRLMDFYYMRLIITVAPTAVTARRALDAADPLIAPTVPTPQRMSPWGQAAAQLRDYRSGVLAAFDGAGRPTLLRVRPEAEVSTAALVMNAPLGADLREGPASMLCHSHNDQLADQNSFVLAGELRQCDGRWLLTGERFIPGPGTGGPLAMVRTVRGMRSTAKRYLDRRGLSRPAVNWAAISELSRQAAMGD